MNEWSELVLVIIDDEPKARELLKNYINLIYPENKFDFILCNSVLDGKKAIETYLPDLVFLDIEMPEANGFELFNVVDKNSFEVVFVTAYSEYIEKSVNEIGCFGYLNKPIEREKLQLIFERFNKKNKSKKIFKFINNVQNKRMLVNLNDILFCKASDNYTEIFMNDGKSKYLLSKTLKKIVSELPEHQFYRVHRSYIVNLQHVNTLDNKKNTLNLNHLNQEWDQNIPISLTYKERIKELLL